VFSGTDVLHARAKHSVLTGFWRLLRPTWHRSLA